MCSSWTVSFELLPHIENDNSVLACSYDEDAENTCEKEVAAALALCPDSLDGLQTLASLRLSQVRKADAAKIISSVFDRVRYTF